MKTDTYNVNNNPPGSPHEVRRAPRAQPTSALRAHTPCWLAMAWSFLNCSSTFSTIFIRAASRRYSSAVCLLELMSLRCSSVRASGRLPHLRPRSGRNFSTDGQEAHSKLKKEVKKGSGKCANGPVDHTCNASGHWAFLWECPHWSWHSACCCSVTAAGLMRPYTCTWLDLPSPCRPLLLPSPLRPPGTRARAYPRRLI